MNNIELTDEERFQLWALCYNILSQGSWPEGLDIPRDIPGTLKTLEACMDKLQPQS